jgi:hypothetical protein
MGAKDEKYVIFTEELKGYGRLGDPDIDGRMILKN